MKKIHRAMRINIHNMWSLNEHLMENWFVFQMTTINEDEVLVILERKVEVADNA